MRRREPIHSILEQPGLKLASRGPFSLSATGTLSPSHIVSPAGCSLASPVLVWFRDDYRLADNPALRAALETGAPILCFALIDEQSEGIRPLGAASRWWLHGSLESLDDLLRLLGSRLVLFRGPTEEIVARIASDTAATALFWNRRYGAPEIAVDTRLKADLATRGVTVESFNGRLLNEPWEVKNKSAKPFRVFTPYSRAAMARRVAPPLPAPGKIPAGTWPKAALGSSVTLKELQLEPTRPNWASGFAETWTRGENAARRKLAAFVDDRLSGYADKRDCPGAHGYSGLSPHLRFGEISPRQVWHAVAAARDEDPSLDRDSQKFLTELTWRDFCYQLLFDIPDLPSSSHLAAFDHMPWSPSEDGLVAWRRGMTGYPIVDAGMRQLWQTGWMHNRVRMIAASFLIKHLLVDWREGERWFWDTLVDADAANNAFNWQWVAGSGPNSAPFHRIFNPVAQGEKFDPDGAYTRAFVPELAGLPNRWLHKPWDAPLADLDAAGVILGETYPRPVVDHAAARERALDAFRVARTRG